MDMLQKNSTQHKRLLLIGNLPFSSIDRVDDIVRWSTVDRAPDALGGAQDLLQRACQILGERLWPHRPCNIDNFVARDVSRVLDVLLLLTVPWWL